MKATDLLRNVQGYKLIKVKRNFAGSYAIEYCGVVSRQFNSGTMKYFINKSDSEFIELSKNILI